MVLIQSIIIALIVLSIWYTMQEGEIFGALGRDFERALPEQLHPPVFACPICMVPWYGTVLYWLYPWEKVGLPVATGWQWPLVILVAMGINIVINKFQTD